MEDKKAFLIYKNMGAHVKKLSDAEAGKLFKALFDFSTDGETGANLTPEADMLYGIMCDHIMMDDEKWNIVRERRASAGRKGAESRWQTMANDGNAIQSVANDGKNGGNGNGYGKGKGNGNGYGDGNKDATTPPAPPAPTTPPAKTPRGHFGNVMLTDAEIESFKKTRPDDWEIRIEHLDHWLEDHPNKKTAPSYRDHLHVLESWARKDDAAPRAKTSSDSSVSHKLERRETDERYAGFITDIFSDETEEWLRRPREVKDGT